MNQQAHQPKPFTQQQGRDLFLLRSHTRQLVEQFNARRDAIGQLYRMGGAA